MLLLMFGVYSDICIPMYTYELICFKLLLIKFQIKWFVITDMYVKLMGWSLNFNGVVLRCEFKCVGII